MKTVSPNILVLGASGMVGSFVFKYLKERYRQSVIGTSHTRSNNTDLKYFDARSVRRDFKNIFSKTKVEYIINCIGILNDSEDKKALIEINALFPHLLSELAEVYQCKIIHISTDAVFAELSHAVFENTPPSPTNIYGMSKVLGEPNNPSVITFRTSFLGRDNSKEKGLLSWIDNTRDEIINGFDNQTWSGCTTLQFAKLCDQIITENIFEKLRKDSSIFHFAPIKKTTKYEIVKTYSLLTQKKIQIKKKAGQEITRYLSSQFENLLEIERYSPTIKEALTELLNVS